MPCACVVMHPNPNMSRWIIGGEISLNVPTEHCINHLAFMGVHIHSTAEQSGSCQYNFSSVLKDQTSERLFSASQTMIFCQLLMLRSCAGFRSFASAENAESAAPCQMPYRSLQRGKSKAPNLLIRDKAGIFTNAYRPRTLHARTLGT